MNLRVLLNLTGFKLSFKFKPFKIILTLYFPFGYRKITLIEK